MELLYYLGWCPVSTLPIQNRVCVVDGFSRQSSTAIMGSRPHEMFRYFPSLLSYEYAVRLDGLFIFRVEFASSASEQDRLEVSREISDHIKSTVGHNHEFHLYPFGCGEVSNVPNEPEFGWYYRLENKAKSLLQALPFSSVESHNVLDVNLHISPVEIEDPFGQEFQEDSGKVFDSLEKVIDPVGNERNIGALV